MPATNYPGADRSQWKPQFGGITMPRLDKVLLHTTETLGWPGYPTFCPQLTVDPWLKQIRQHLPVNVSASTLADPSSTAVRENRDNVVQIEIVGFCDPARANTAKYIYKMGDPEYLFLAEILAWFHTEWDVPLVSTVKWLRYPDSYGNRNGQRLTGPQYDAYRGILGHQHVSGNDHGDPGALNITRLLDLAKSLALPPEPKPNPDPAPLRPIAQPWRPGDVLPGATLTTPFGEPGDWIAGFHTGDDWNVGDGGEDYWFPVYAPKAGKVTHVGEGGWGPAYGRQVHITYDDNGRIGMFAHLAKPEVAQGDEVEPGRMVGRVGYSGNVRPVGIGGAHLHYEERVAPYRYGEDARAPVYWETDPVPPKVTVLQVATWNTRRSSAAADEGTERDWDVRDDLARDFLLGIPGRLPDVLLTQETTKEQQLDIARFTGLQGIGNGLGGHPKDISGDNVSVFLGAGVEKLGVVTVNSGDASDPLPRRYMTCVEINVKGTGTSMWVGSTHLNRANTTAQKRTETRALLNAAKEAGVDMARFVFVGDINDATEASRPGVRQTARDDFGLVDIRDLLSDAQFRGDSWDTFTGWTPEVEKNGRHIDAIMIGPELRVTLGEIVPVRNGASDHNMILCTIMPPPDEGE